MASGNCVSNSIPSTGKTVTEIAHYPSEFVDALTQAGYLGALIPQQYAASNYHLAPRLRF